MGVRLALQAPDAKQLHAAGRESALSSTAPIGLDCKECLGDQALRLAMITEVFRCPDAVRDFRCI